MLRRVFKVGDGGEKREERGRANDEVGGWGAERTNERANELSNRDMSRLRKGVAEEKVKKKMAGR